MISARGWLLARVLFLIVVLGYLAYLMVRALR